MRTRLLVFGLLLGSCVPCHAQPFPSPDPLSGLAATYPELGRAVIVYRALAKPLLFLAILVFVGVLVGALVDRVIGPRPPGAPEGYVPDPRVVRRRAVGQLVVWLVALTMAFHAVGIVWLGEVMVRIVGLVAAALVAGAILAAAAVFGVSLGARGRDFALSLLGWYYLHHHPNRPTPEQPIDLGSSRIGRIARVGLLHTVFDLGGGRCEVRPNAWLMQTHFGWGSASGEPLPPESLPPS